MYCPGRQAPESARGQVLRAVRHPAAPDLLSLRRRVASTARFCSQCAHPTGLPVTTAAPVARFGAPGSNTPQYLAERILGSKAGSCRASEST